MHQQVFNQAAQAAKVGFGGQNVVKATAGATALGSAYVAAHGGLAATLTALAGGTVATVAAPVALTGVAGFALYKLFKRK